jgi:dihydroorotase
MKKTILKNAFLYINGTTQVGSLLIKRGKIEKIIINGKPLKKKFKQLFRRNHIEIDCGGRIIIPGLIDIHSHLRDMGQSEKETFLTGTRAAAYSGITTVFNMPNTIPPANTGNQISLWLKKAKSNIYIDVGLIAGFPGSFDRFRINKIIKKSIIGFKIYPHKPLNRINWTDKENINHLFDVSSKFNIPIFIHPEWPLTKREKEFLQNEILSKTVNLLELYNEIKSPDKELRYVKFIIDTYIEYIKENPRDSQQYPIIHFCHISTKQSFEFIRNFQLANKNFKITMEVTPHHLLLTKKINLENPNIGKVDPPLRDQEDQLFLYDQFKEGNIYIIASDHAPHTLDEKSQGFFDAPSGFPEFETYSLILLDKVFNKEISLKCFVQACSENPALTFRLKHKGFIKEGYQADLVIIEKVEPYNINPNNFKSKAKFSPYIGFRTRAKIWKVFIRGIEVNKEKITPKGKIVTI